MSQDSQLPARPRSSANGPARDVPTGDLREYVAVLKRQKTSLILVVLATMAAAAFFSYRQDPMYRSAATVQVKALNPNPILQGYNPTYGISMETEQALAVSPDVSAIAAKKAKNAGSRTQDSGNVSTGVPPDTTFLTITYSAPEPREAQIWAQSYAMAYMENRREQALEQYDAAQEEFKKKIDELQSQVTVLEAARTNANATRKAEINSKIKTLRGSVADLVSQSAEIRFPVVDTAAQLIAPATLPTAPYSPNWSQNLVMALIAGLALGFGVVFIRERLDDHIGGREELEDASGAPVLAIVPEVPGWRKKSDTTLIARDAPMTAPAEAYRTLRTNVSFMARANDLKLIAITSPGMGEGKTTTTANLGVALAQTGKRVIAVSCDLRKPRLHHFFELQNHNGITSIIRDGLTIPHVAQRVPGIETLRIIASGPMPHDPSELLGSEDMEQLLQDLRRYADFVLIDTAPTLVVSDALTIAPKTDGVLVVVDANSTLRGAVDATREQLELVGANIVGSILNHFDPARARGSHRYHYYGQYEYQEEGKGEERMPRRPIDPSEIWE